MPKPYPREFRDDVVRVARSRESGVTVEQIAKDFGVHPMTLFKWLRQAEADEGAKPGVWRGESAELREARRRIKLLEQENEAPHRIRNNHDHTSHPGCVTKTVTYSCSRPDRRSRRICRRLYQEDLHHLRVSPVYGSGSCSGTSRTGT